MSTSPHVRPSNYESRSPKNSPAATATLLISDPKASRRIDWIANGQDQPYCTPPE
jgi:hypothetical protein